MGNATKYERVVVDQLIPYINNAKIHTDEQVTKIASSIREFGFLNPVLIDLNHNVIAGHGRIMAAKKLGLKEVPAVYVEGLTDAQRKAYILADNRLAEMAEWDMDLLQTELDELMEAGFDISLTGLDDMQFSDKTEDDIEEDDYDEEEEQPKPRTQPGDIYRLGEHRLICGDSTDPGTLDKLLDGIKPLFCFTDPPYGVAIGSKNKALEVAQKAGSVKKDIKNDTLAPNELYTILKAAMTNLREHCAEDCSYYVSSPPGEDLITMLEVMRDAGLPVRHNIIWVKNIATFSIGRLDYDYKHEPIFYTWTKNHHFYADQYKTTVIDDTTPIDKMSKAELKERLRAYEDQNSVAYCDKPLKSELHPTMKPVKLVGRFMLNNSQPGDAVIDIFGGSGTTLIAAEQLNRKCYMVELDPHYCDVIIDRWEKFTGQKAKK